MRIRAAVIVATLSTLLSACGGTDTCSEYCDRLAECVEGTSSDVCYDGFREALQNPGLRDGTLQECAVLKDTLTQCEEFGDNTNGGNDPLDSGAGAGR